MNITFRQCVSDDIYTLQNFSYRTFNETYINMNTSSNMKAYLEEAFDVNKLRGELADSNSLFYFLYADGELAGYLKLNESAAQTDINDLQSIEIERIYIANEFQGKGLGGVLINKAIDIAKMRKKSYLWLGVWEKNDKAILFYKKNGFEEIGTHSFFMGDEEQTDLIMRKIL
ncbi:protease synthase and sporulation negative regulatory protein PAI 1 [Oxobacter pfennigii]|uniref:Protease synthase and sporulation negative regulatory protein PAI 1 n=1 Tax=Oxobacter pfennigii TaxID=36849 RepID=A0A0P8YXB4_9CLOT|nr:GNAT family N-acetyltransferase [Oxobacter pfennigii]KPU44362.1 protease synthase and sporulation negative regulatory protein PAI 1 [Oxobacter pfennigii]